MLLIALPLVGCSSSKFDAKPRIGSSALKADGVGSTDASIDDAIPVSGAVPDPVVNEGPVPVVTNTVDITPEPAIGPTIVAGATLTCIRTTVKTEVSCKALSAGKAIDLVPKNLYHIKGSPGVWVPVEYKRTNVGTYLADLKDVPPSTFAMALVYGDSQYLIDMVAKELAAPAYANLIKDPSFNALTPKDSVDDFDFFTNVELAALGSAWTISNAATDSACAVPKLKLQGINHLNPGAPNTRWVNLLSACDADYGAASVFNRTRLSQKIKTNGTHLHFIYYNVKRNLPSNDPKSLKLDLMINGFFYPFSYITNDAWEMHEVRVGPGQMVTEADISFNNVTQTPDLGVHLDDIRVYDLGVPVLK